MNILYIDTKNNQEITVRLIIDGKEFEEKSVAKRERAQEALPLIKKITERAGIKISDINEINVERGPGSFTGLRVGVSIANALSFGLGTKINGKNSERLSYRNTSFTINN